MGQSVTTIESVMMRLARWIALIHDLIDSLFPYICLPGRGDDGRRPGTSEEEKRMSRKSES